MLAALFSVPAVALAVPADDLTITLRPVAAIDGQIVSLQVSEHFSNLNASDGDALFRLPLIVSNVDSVATILSGVVATDALGPVALTTRDIYLPVSHAGDAESGGPSREWLAARAVSGPVVLRYTVPANAV